MREECPKVHSTSGTARCILAHKTSRRIPWALLHAIYISVRLIAFDRAQKFPRQRREGIGLSLGYDQREEGNQAAEDKVYDAEQDVLNARILEHCSWEGTADCVNAIQAIPPLIVITPSSMHPCGFLSEFSVTLSFLSLSPVSPLPPPSSQGTPTTRRRIILRQIPQPFANRNRSLASKEFLSIPNSSGALGRLSTVRGSQLSRR